MSDTAIIFENISKQYRLGKIGTGTLSHDLNRWWARIRGKEDPFLKVTEVNDRAAGKVSDYIWALRDINLDIDTGDVFGIIGKNGAGKSTLLKILSRVTTPTIGTIKARGRIASLLEVGTGFHPEMTGRENIFMNGAIMGMTKAEIRHKFDEIVDFAGIAKYIDTPVKRYSSGMTVRLGFAIAAHLEPEILVVDEVLAVGDAEFQKKAIGKMQDVSHQKGRTVLFVSHNMQSIQSLCNKTVILDKGQIVFEGETNQAIKTYNSSTVTARYEGKPLPSKPRVTTAYFTDDQKRAITRARPGEPFTLVIGVDNPTEREVELQVTFWDGFGVLIWNFTHQFFDVEPLPAGKKTITEFRFDPPLLNIDELFLHIGLSYKGESFYALTDHIINAASLVIENTYGIGKQSNGIIRCPVNVRIYDQKDYQ